MTGSVQVILGPKNRIARLYDNDRMLQMFLQELFIAAIVTQIKQGLMTVLVLACMEVGC